MTIHANRMHLRRGAKTMAYLVVLSHVIFQNLPKLMFAITHITFHQLAPLSLSLSSSIKYTLKSNELFTWSSLRSRTVS